jgi:predicted DNA binding CopG/RHH family protein
MRKQYDFSKSVRNPHARRLKKQITIRIDENTIDYFKQLANESGLSYQVLIDLYLRQCAGEKKKPRINWAA